MAWAAASYRPTGINHPAPAKLSRVVPCSNMATEWATEWATQRWQDSHSRTTLVVFLTFSPPHKAHNNPCNLHSAEEQLGRLRKTLSGHTQAPHGGRQKQQTNNKGQCTTATAGGAQTQYCSFTLQNLVLFCSWDDHWDVTKPQESGSRMHKKCMQPCNATMQALLLSHSHDEPFHVINATTTGAQM